MGRGSQHSRTALFLAPQHSSTHALQRAADDDLRISARSLLDHPQPPAASGPLPSPSLVPVGSWLPRSLVSAILLSSVRCGTKGVGWSVGRCGGRRRLGGSVAERNRSSTEPVAAEVAAAADDDDNNDDGFGIRVARCGGGRWQWSGPRHAHTSHRLRCQKLTREMYFSGILA